MEEANSISSYPLKQAIDDGMLAAILPQRWGQLTNGKPLVATAAIMEAFSMAAIMEMWNEYVNWSKNIAPTLPEADRLFATKMNDQTVWVLEDDAAFTVLFPSDY